MTPQEFAAGPRTASFSLPHDTSTREFGMKGFVVRQTETDEAVAATRFAATVARLPHLSDYETPDPSILPIRNTPVSLASSTLAAADIPRPVAEPRVAQPLFPTTFVQHAHWLTDRLVHDRLLLASWVCILILSVLVFVRPIEVSKPKSNDELVPLIVHHDTHNHASTTAATETTATSTLDTTTAGPIPNLFASDATWQPPQSASDSESALAPSPWEREVTSGYSPWNAVTAVQEPTASMQIPEPNTPITGYAPTGFAGYDPGRTIGDPDSEQNLVMRPATPLASVPIQQPMQYPHPAQGQGVQGAPGTAYPPTAYQVPPTRPIYGQVPVVASAQTYRNGVADGTAPTLPNHYATPQPPMNGNYQVASAAPAYANGYAPANAVAAPQQPYPYPNAQRPANAPMNPPVNAPVIW